VIVDDPRDFRQWLKLLQERDARIHFLEEALRDIAADDCGACDTAARAKRALGDNLYSAEESHP